MSYRSFNFSVKWLITLLTFGMSLSAQAAYVFQTVPGEVFDTVTNTVVWTNDSNQTGYPSDDDYQLVNIGFTFYLGETGYNQVRILSNGALHFGGDQGFHKYFTNEALPITGSYNGPGFEEPADRVIAGYWDDLEPSLGGFVRYSTLGTGPNRRFVASWQNVPRYNGFATSYSFQIVLYENGNVRFRYGNDQANGSSATIGIEVDNTDFTQFSYNSIAVSDLLDILWVREFPPINTVLADCLVNDKVIVTFSAPVSPARANDPSNFSIDNGVTISASTYINETTVELSTSPLLTGLNYTLTTTYPNQSESFQLGVITTNTYLDTFATVAYNNNDTSDLWAGNWIESFDNNSANSGRIFISGGELYMNDNPNSNNTPQMEREVNLLAFTSATFSYDYRTSNTLEDSDVFEVAVSNNGGISYTTIQSYSNDSSGSELFDITTYISVNTRIRFRVATNYGGGNEYMILDNVTVTGSAIAPCTPEVDHYEITHDGNGINCLREAINIAAIDSSGNPVTQYEGTINLATTTNNGNWYVADESNNSADNAFGTLTETLNDDGAATYQFALADAGTVTLYLNNTHNETTNIQISEGIITDDNTEGDITFRPFGFIVNPTNITTQIAGRAFNATLTAAGQTPAQPNCGVIQEYTGAQTINFWSVYNSPATSPTALQINGANIATSEAASAPQNVTFNSGVTTLSIQYNDVGQLSFSAKDDSGIGEPPPGTTNEIIGGVSPFYVRPFGYDLLISGSPYADAADPDDLVYAVSGSNFSMTIRSVLWESADDIINNSDNSPVPDGIPDPFFDSNGDGIPDTGGDLSNNGVTPNISQVTSNSAIDSINLAPNALVVTNSNGVLGVNSVSFSSFAPTGSVNAGTVTIADQSWSEVGILEINATTTNFMNSGQGAQGQRINIGRFIPNQFNISITDDFSAQCSTNFTYAGYNNGSAGLDKSGQPDVVEFSVQAVNLANNPTVNYFGAFAKLENGTLLTTPFNIATAASTTGSFNFTAPTITFNTSGNATITLTDLYYQYDTEAAEFDLRIDLDATDADAVNGTISSAAVEQRLGRLRLIDAYGPETSDLEITLASDYFNGSQWQLNNVDSCTNYIQTDATLDASSYTDNLSAGETAAFSPAGLQTLVNGQSNNSNGIWFSAAGDGNFGSVNVEYDLSTQPWLMYDWNVDSNNNPPSALLNFGYYRGSDRVIYWREIRY